MKGKRVGIAAVCVMVLIAGFLAAGCSPAAKQAVQSPVNLAAESANDISLGYLHLRNLSEEISANGTPDQQKFAHAKVNPSLNKAQALIPAYDRAVATWERTGQGQVSAELKKKEINDLLDSASALLIQIVGEALVNQKTPVAPATK